MSTSAPRTPGLPPALSCFLVEDSTLIRTNLIATMEEMLPLEVIAWADDEAGAVRWMSEHGARCNLIIIDIFLKAGNGLEVLSHAGMLCPQARRVVLTNYATVEIRSRCAGLGAHRLFDKSAELEELIDYCAQLAAELSA